MGTFEDLHQDRVIGSLAMFDRMIFKGYLSGLQAGERALLPVDPGSGTQGLHAVGEGDDRAHRQQRPAVVTEAGRPVISFDHVKTRNRPHLKEEIARQVAERDGVTEGIICLISAVETCMSFQVRKNMKTGRIDAARRERKCLHHYLVRH